MGNFMSCSRRQNSSNLLSRFAPRISCRPRFSGRWPGFSEARNAVLEGIPMPNFSVASAAALCFPTGVVLSPTWMYLYARQYLSLSSALSSGGSFFFLDYRVAAASLAC